MTDDRKTEPMQAYPTLRIADCLDYLIRLIRAMSIVVLLLGLASCGGGSGTSGNTSPMTTITSITPVGIVAPAISQSLSILGTNFVSGMTVSVTDKNGVGYTVTPAVVSSPTVITVNVTITATPTDNYVNVTVIPTNSTPPVTAVLGVAGTNSTLATNVQAIFNANCIACHDGSAFPYLDLRSSASAAGLINTSSSWLQCSSKLRVTPGDPRRTSTMLIDKIQASGGLPACGSPMPLGLPALNPTDIQTIIDWVAGGAN
jgi:hypothetical protein